MDLLSLADASSLLLQDQPPPFADSRLDDLPPASGQPPLDRVGGGVGGGGAAIGPRRRSRRGPAPRTPQQQARSVARRNARERKRVRLVNLGFATLRDHIPPHFGVVAHAKARAAAKASPSSGSSKKLSKVETLRYAIEYIKQLREAVGCEEGTSEGFSSSSSPPDLSSPSPSPSYCTTPSPALLLASPDAFPDADPDDDFLDIDWTTL